MSRGLRSSLSLCIAAFAALGMLASPLSAQDRSQLPQIEYDGQIQILRPIFEDLNALRVLHNSGEEVPVDALCEMFPRLSAAEFMLMIPTGDYICTTRFFIFSSCEEERIREPQGSVALLGAQAQFSVIVAAHTEGGSFVRLLESCSTDPN